MYAVWFHMIPADEREKWDSDLLNDPRVRQFWDADRVIGTWVAQHAGECAHSSPIDWDSFYLFDGGGKWSDALEGVKACGRPVYDASDNLARAAAALFGENDEP